jgi:aspartate aminotransferase
MSLSQLAKSISESPTLKLNSIAAALREKGEPVIHLGGGEPKSKAPLDAVTNCTSFLSTREVRYTPADGIPALKKAVARYTAEHYHKPVLPENVIVSGGAKQALMVLLHAILDPKEEVVFLAPYWVSYPEMVKLAGGVPVVVAPQDRNFCPTVKEIAEAVGPRAKAVLLNTPNNPSGVMYTREFIAEIVEFSEKKGLYLIMDDIYNRLVFGGKSAPICYEFARAPLEESKLVVINGVSKMYAMTGFRIGWAVGNRELVQAMTSIQSQQTSGPSAPAQWAALGALNGDQSCVETLRQTLENNCHVMVEGLKAIAGIRVIPPEGTFYCFPDFSAYMPDSQKLAQFLLEKVRVVTVPGKEFGCEGHLRLSYCGSSQEIVEGLQRIEWALNPNAPREFWLGNRKLVRDWV